MDFRILMALFLSTYVNKVDKKGRVSVPSQFRAALTGQEFHGVILFRSSKFDALEGFTWDFMRDLADRVDSFDLFSDAQDDLATAIFSDSVQLPFDNEGRIILPQSLMDHAGINDQAAFVGLGKKFQLWSPERLAARQAAARKNVQEKGLTIPQQGGGGHDK